MFRRVLSPLIALLAGVAPLQAQDVLTPKAVASEFLSAVSARQWDTVIRLTDHDSLWEYVTRTRQQLRQVAAAPLHEPPTVETYLRDEPTMPRAVAEYFVARNARYTHTPAQTLLLVIADVEEPSQLDSLSDDEVYIRLLRARQMDYQVAAAARVGGCPLDSATIARLPVVRRTVRGVALLSETEAVALYEDENYSQLPAEFRQFSQLTLQRTKAGWRIVASEKVLGPMGMGMAVGFESCSDKQDPH